MIVCLCSVLTGVREYVCVCVIVIVNLAIYDKREKDVCDVCDVMCDVREIMSLGS